MKMIHAKHYGYRELFNVEIDEVERKYTIVGKDSRGQYILNTSEEYNSGNAYATDEVYFILDKSEYLLYLQRALESGNVSKEEYKKLFNA